MIITIKIEDTVPNTSIILAEERRMPIESNDLSNFDLIHEIIRTMIRKVQHKVKAHDAGGD